MTMGCGFSTGFYSWNGLWGKRTLWGCSLENLAPQGIWYLCTVLRLDCINSWIFGHKQEQQRLCRCHKLEFGALKSLRLKNLRFRICVFLRAFPGMFEKMAANHRQCLAFSNAIGEILYFHNIFLTPGIKNS